VVFSLFHATDPGTCPHFGVLGGPQSSKIQPLDTCLASYFHSRPGVFLVDSDFVRVFALMALPAYLRRPINPPGYKPTPYQVFRALYIRYLLTHFPLLLTESM